MQHLLVLYPEPADRAAFTEHFEKTHLPLVAELPGLLTSQHSFDVSGVGGGSPYFAIFDATFASAEALQDALASPEGQAVAADVPRYATGGSEIVLFSPAGPDPHEVLLSYLRAWAARDVEGITAHLAEDGQYTDPALRGTTLGPKGLPDYLEQLFALVPDLSLTVTHSARTGPDTAIAFWRMSGTAPGPYPSSSGGALTLTGGDVVRIDALGRILWTEALFDQKGFAEQAGLVAPAP